MENQGMKPRVRFETLICYESVYSELSSTGIKEGAEFIAIVTNDGWWGKTAGPVQHEQYAVLRAIETRKWIVRCAQTGVSCFIDPLGNISDEIGYNTEGIAIKNIIANNEKTFFVQNGDLTGRISFYVFIAAIAVIVINYATIKILKRKA
jgi:apolipoprotein N-acyltransferase